MTGEHAGVSPAESEPPAGVPLMIYDGDCAFCREWIERWRTITGDRVAYLPYQHVATRHPEIPVARFREAVHLLEPDGRWSRGAEAVFRSLASVPGHRRWRWSYDHLPGFAWLAEAAYRVVARHRGFFARVSRMLFGPPDE